MYRATKSSTPLEYKELLGLWDNTKSYAQTSNDASSQLMSQVSRLQKKIDDLENTVR